MNQQINFYNQILKTRNIPLSFNVMKIFIYGLMIFMAAATFSLIVIQIKNERDLKHLEAKQQNTFSQLQSQESKLTSKNDREKIITQIESTNQSYEKNKKTLQELENLLNSGTEGFSKALISLSKSVPRGLWLTKIELNDSGKTFSLIGKTIEAKLVTEFISALKKESSFKGKILEIFDISYNKTDNALDFKIQTGKPRTENP
ncbi:MAG: hypothetical protein RLZ35_509 [Pseudomonadota bacterium]|jgi:Tfp pilus assembly protein PilN